jgi:hypothetical protein
LVVVHQPVLRQGPAAGKDDLHVLQDGEGSLDEKGWLRELQGITVFLLHNITSRFVSFFVFRELSPLNLKAKV